MVILSKLTRSALTKVIGLIELKKARLRMKKIAQRAFFLMKFICFRSDLNVYILEDLHSIELLRFKILSRNYISYQLV